MCPASGAGQGISEQVRLFDDFIKGAKGQLLLAHQLAVRIKAAFEADVLKEEQALQFADAVVDNITDLQAMLVHDWSGSRTDREILELLHLIYFPKRDYAGSLDDHLLDIRRRFPRNEADSGSRGMKHYWELLRKYAEEHPDEPLGWRDKVEP